jgi:hypothetical protein
MVISGIDDPVRTIFNSHRPALRTGNSAADALPPIALSTDTPSPETLNLKALDLKARSTRVICLVPASDEDEFTSYEIAQYEIT